MYMRNNDSHNCLYFMLGATMTALGCMGYCMCKDKGYLEKLSGNHGNGRGMLNMKGKRHLGHHGHGVNEEYQGYQMEEENGNMNSDNQQRQQNGNMNSNNQQRQENGQNQFSNEMKSSQQNMQNQQSNNKNNKNSKNPENEQQKEQQVTH